MQARNIAHLVLGAALAASGWYGIAVGELISFKAGDPIKSAEVNQNFSTLKSAVAALEAPINTARLADAAVTLPKLSVGGTASDGKVLKLQGGNLSWADDQIGTSSEGDITAVNAGSGLSGGGASGEVSLSVNTSLIQSRINNTCPAGSSIRAIGGDGAVTCESEREIQSGTAYTKWYPTNGFYPLHFGFGSQDRARIRVQDNSSTESFMQFFTVNPSTDAQFANLTLLSSGSSYFTGSGGSRCTYSGGSGWNCTSDKNAKENFRPANPEQVLESLVKMPITTWNMKGDKNKTRHLGPVAQDFKAAFRLGDDDTTINSGDAQGVAMAAIQGLYKKNQALQAQNQALQTKLAALEQRLARVEHALSASK